MNERDSKKGVKLYIKYVPSSFTNESLKSILSQFGTVIYVSIDKPPFKHTKFSYAFVTVATSRDALNIIENVNRKPPLNLLVEMARERVRNGGPVEEFLQKREKIFNQDPLLYSQMNGTTNEVLQNGYISSEVGKRPNPEISRLNPSSSSGMAKLGGNCVKCSKSATKRCSVCKAYYCSITCQFNDWFEHHQFKCRKPPPLEESADFEVNNNDSEIKSFASENRSFPPESRSFPSESRSFVPDSSLDNIKVEEKVTACDVPDSSYSFSRLLKAASVTSKIEVNPSVAEVKDVNIPKRVEKVTEIDISKSIDGERLLDSTLKKVPVPNNDLLYKDNFVKNIPVNKNPKLLPFSFVSSNPEKEINLTQQEKLEINLTQQEKLEINLIQEEKLIKKEIPTEKLKIGSEYNVFATYLDGDTLYIQLASDQKAAMIKEMTVTMANSCSTAAVPKTLKIGEVVCCYVSRHDTWYRGEVLEVKSWKILVYFFDFGYKEVVHINELRICDPKLKNFPIMAIPVNPIYNCSQSEMSEALNSYIEESNPILMIVVEENPLKVELMDITGQMRIIPNQVPVEETPECNAMQTHSENSKAFKLLKSGEVKPAMPLYDECRSTSLPVKDGVEIFILNPDNPLSIFAVPMENVDLYQTLEGVSSEMNEYCNSISNTYYEPQEGEICIAKFSADNLWYRAACIIQNRSSALVIFVDYGNQEEVPFINICQMVDKFLEVPLIALHCQINGFTKEEVLAGGSKLEEKFKNLLPPNSSQTVNVVDKCEASHLYVLEIPSLDIKKLKKDTLY